VIYVLEPGPNHDPYVESSAGGCNWCHYVYSDYLDTVQDWQYHTRRPPTQTELIIAELEGSIRIRTLKGFRTQTGERLHD